MPILPVWATILLQVVQAVGRHGVDVLEAIDRAKNLIVKLREEDRDDVTDEELAAISASINERQDRIDSA